MSKTDKDEKQDPALSKNHNKSVKYRKRVQEEAEAEQEIKEYYDTDGNPFPRDWLNYGGTD